MGLTATRAVRAGADRGETSFNSDAHPVITGANRPCGVAVDGQHIYWVDPSARAIGRANLDGTGVNPSFITGTGSGSRGIAVSLSGLGPAYAKLNQLAASMLPSGEKTVREFWAGGNGNAPKRSALDALQQGILAFAGCSGSTNGGSPYASCTPPAGSSGFSAQDWTAVVNEIFKEIDLARHVDDFFDTMGQVQQKLFISHRNELDAIAAAMHIQNATGNTTSISPYEAVGTVLEVLGAISAGAELATPLWVAMDVAGIVMTIQTSDSPTLDSTFSATYADLNDKFATMVDEIEKGLEVQSLEIRHSYQLMQLITQLTTGGGPWANPDLIGLESTSDEGFALWAYKQLLPTTYARYTVENCLWKNQNSFQGEPGCELSGAGPETIGGQDTNHTVTIVLQPTNPSDTGSPTTPCNTHESAARVNHCVFQVVPKEISTRLWGPVADTCQYVPGNPQTKWTFGCGLGVDKNFSVDMARGTANGWDFPSYCLDWQLYYPEKACSATTTTARANVGARGGLVLGGQFRLPRGFRVKDAAIPGNGLLYETAGPRAPIAATRGLTLRVVHTSARGARAALATPARSGATLTLAPATRGRLSYSLAVGNVNVALPAACQARPASDSLSTPPVQLTTTILLTDGARTIPARLAGIWRCVRDRSGTITRLLPVPPPRLSRRPGLAVSVSGPRNVVPKHQTTYLIRVSNRRRGPRDRFASSLWHVLVYGSLRAGSATANRSLGPISRVTELRRGRSRTFRVTVTIPRAARGRACVSVGALADAARTAAARTCALVQSAQLRSRSSGLG